MIAEAVLQKDSKESLKHVITLKNEQRKVSSIIIEISPNIRKILLSECKVKIGMCEYEICGQVRVTQCNRCLKTGHIAKYCRSKSDICGICSLDHTTKSCPPLNGLPTLYLNHEKYRNLREKNCSNSSNHKRFQYQADTHGSIDKHKCPFFVKNQCLNLQQQIDYGS